MSSQTIEKFCVVGISVRTTNENGQSGKDIPELWNRFMTENISEKIPNKTGNAVYVIYTDYEKDHTKPYTTIIGCKVSNSASVPEGMIEKTIEQAAYAKYAVKGNILQGLVFDAWVKIWNADIQRAFTADFEVYGEKAQNPEQAEVDIFIAVK
ncbi:GyrI-like domain-containing protein [Pedobacter punctiformis]|uniref:GyrI-like domain-containing protein n=1 Tax=Pedobacter punctiformis TaxID=3004097 RepID=A0ABT4LA78_9SPHI|nr:GyrI-like domain-containing protein [Pedobacter sp. HCMS5-2]MCZ4244837.1 GyrI-like domain-containing protein [Pedobacter sp. HCMS5-2]